MEKRTIVWGTFFIILMIGIIFCAAYNVDSSYYLYTVLGAAGVSFILELSIAEPIVSKTNRGRAHGEDFEADANQDYKPLSDKSS